MYMYKPGPSPRPCTELPVGKEQLNTLGWCKLSASLAGIICCKRGIGECSRKAVAGSEDSHSQHSLPLLPALTFLPFPSFPRVSEPWREHVAICIVQLYFLCSKWDCVSIPFYSFLCLQDTMVGVTIFTLVGASCLCYHKSCSMLGVVVRTFNSSTQEAEPGGISVSSRLVSGFLRPNSPQHP